MDPVSDHEVARREILRGQALISQLRATLERSSSDRDTVDVLMEEISSSLTRALDCLNCNETRNLEASLNPNPNPRPNISNRGSNGRNRDEYVQRIICTKPYEDGQAWNKYGQKTIASSPYPRCYFKCCLRKDQGCKALKQVQQTESNPAKFLVTYIGKHTCTASMNEDFPPDQFILSFGADSNSDEPLQNWSSATSRSPGMASEISNSPNPSDSDSMTSFYDSGSCFYYDENSSFNHCF